MKKKTIKLLKVIVWEFNLYTWLLLLITSCICNTIVSIYALANGLDPWLVGINAVGLLWIFFTTYAVITQVTVNEIKRIEGD